MPARKSSTQIVAVEFVQQHILIIRGQRVISDANLARLYGVTTKRLNQQVNRNVERFPDDFMFQLTVDETENLRLQIATSSLHGGRRYAPNVFTEHGAIMAANVLNSPRAVSASLFVVRAFVKLREFLSTNQQLAAKLNELEHRLGDHDSQIHTLFDAIRQLMEAPEEPAKPPIGFTTEIAGPKHTQSARRKNR